jgi:hypothetical protein
MPMAGVRKPHLRTMGYVLIAGNRNWHGLAGVCHGSSEKRCALRFCKAATIFQTRRDAKKAIRTSEGFDDASWQIVPVAYLKDSVK